MFNSSARGVPVPGLDSGIVDNVVVLVCGFLISFIATKVLTPPCSKLQGSGAPMERLKFLSRRFLMMYPAAKERKIRPTTIATASATLGPRVLEESESLEDESSDEADAEAALAAEELLVEADAGLVDASTEAVDVGLSSLVVEEVSETDALEVVCADVLVGVIELATAEVYTLLSVKLTRKISKGRLTASAA